MRFGRWTVLDSVTGLATRSNIKLRCRCDCGTEACRSLNELASGHSKSCGCGRFSDNPPTLGSQHGNWTVTGCRGVDGKFPVRCQCGAERRFAQYKFSPKYIPSSCGCERRVVLGREVEHSTWRGMLQRCSNPSAHNYERYGARGIRVHESWTGAGGFERFYEHIGPRPSAQHSIDRIDNNGNYEPGNVRWATVEQQVANKRPRRRVVDDVSIALMRHMTRRGARAEDLAHAFGVARVTAFVLTRDARKERKAARKAGRP